MKMPSPKKVSFHTLGCKLNFSETSTIARQFEEGGYATVRHAAEADICVVNTCAVTEHAEKKCRNLIRRLHREAPQAIIAVTGCYAQLRPEELAAIEGVDLVLGIQAISDGLPASGSLTCSRRSTGWRASNATASLPSSRTF